MPVAEFTTLSAPDFVSDSGANKGYWRRQLRGKDGRFIEMGGGIEWTDSKGERRLGTVDGFDDEIQRVIVKDSDGNEYKLSADEIKQSATKAVIPDADDDSTPTPEGDAEELDFDALITELEGKPVDIEKFMGDESKFPVGGPPLEIKDKQGKPIATLTKKKDDDGNYSILFSLLLALLPHDLSSLSRRPFLLCRLPRLSCPLSSRSLFRTMSPQLRPRTRKLPQTHPRTSSTPSERTPAPPLRIPQPPHPPQTKHSPHPLTISSTTPRRKTNDRAHR